ncbi:putative pre-mRNA-splicing factor ATP-dependent RNA helicase [Acorus calamus]|uniref:Pre-mRNA-splicing factor ATP-dependent RNA helicase n=1 Tax=Acorus calamus TaxID=4465 RepID=A0AAV9DTH1_ACOCL|nr:putative pre-mRNA-splicing factor ATP-dependent RNA helicase [Acorus calamus]
MRKRGPKKGGAAAEDNSVVTEATRIRISKVLEEFRASDADVYTFEPGLTKNDRAAIHEMCRKMGMISKSSGFGPKRCLSVYKNRKKSLSLEKGKESLSCLRFSEESRKVLQDLFTQHPPQDEEVSEGLAEHHRRKNNKRHGKQDNSLSKPSMSTAEIAEKRDLLATRIKDMEDLRQVAESRSKLPIASFKDVIISTLESNQVILVSGETGCGKTTQVPQYILDHMWSKGEACKIICTQPRRISAISVAERISYERGENVGDSIGYKIRLEAKGGQHSSVMFCTNGILLRMLISRGANISKSDSKNGQPKNGLQGITHIVVDEIHERDRFSDFMLAILRDLLPSFPHLRLILMSATIDAERFSQYFRGCPIILVPGFTHPVKTFYLEDVLSILKSSENNHLDHASLSKEDATLLSEEHKSALDEAIALALSDDEFGPLLELVSTESTPKVYNYQHSSTGATPLMVLAKKGRVGDVCMLLSLGADCQLHANDGNTCLDWARQENQNEICEIIRNHMGSDTSKSAEKEQLLDKYLSSINPELIDTVLIERLLRKICSDSQEGAILVFLPGWDDINQTRERLLASPFFRDSSKFVILSLHSMIPSAEQKKVFKRPPVGVRKIILSTNIAETAVTIDDVVFVIDSGRMKEKSYDPYNNVSTLHSAWVSKASAKQREGRAGRCQPGICYHLYSKIRLESLPDYQVPEIKRMPIEELCLQVKLLDPHCKVGDFLQKTLDPPVFETIRNAIIVLQDIGALTDDEKLTELGEKLGSLPVHPSTSKMLFFAILMNCLDPALTLACAADYRDPFLLPMAPEERKRAAAAKIKLASLYGGMSDQLAIVAAFDCWRREKEIGREAQFCSQYFVSSTTMNMLFRMRKQLQNELATNGFIPVDTSSCSLNSRDHGILRAVLMAGAYPMVGRLLPRLKNGQRAVVETSSGAKVRLHPHSSNFKLSFGKSSESPLIIYDEITRGDGGGMHIRNCTVVGPYPLLLLATEMVVAPAKDDDDDSDGDTDYGSDDDEMTVEESSTGQQGERIMSSPDNLVSVVADRWLTFQSTALDVAQIYCLRERLTTAILFKVKNPRSDLPPALGASMYAIACVLSYDGLSGVHPALESVDSLTSMVNTTGIDKHAQGKRGMARNFDRSNGFSRTKMEDPQVTSPSHFHRSKLVVPNGRNHSNPPPHMNVQPGAQVGKHLLQRAPSQGPTLVGSNSRSGSFKRKRGSGPR